MSEQPLAEFDVDAVGGVRKRVSAQILQRDVEEPDHHETGGHDKKRFVASMGQHFVDDDLKDQRRRYREELNEQGGGKHMAERMAIAPKRRQEPSEAERFRGDAGAPDAARNK